MLKIVQISNLWYGASKDGELRCSDTLAGAIETWRPVVILPRAVFLMLAAEFGEALKSVAIDDAPSNQDGLAGRDVTEIALEDLTPKDRYVTYHVVVTAVG